MRHRNETSYCQNGSWVSFTMHQQCWCVLKRFQVNTCIYLPLTFGVATVDFCIGCAQCIIAPVRPYVHNPPADGWNWETNVEYRLTLHCKTDSTLTLGLYFVIIYDCQLILNNMLWLIRYVCFSAAGCWIKAIFLCSLGVQTLLTAYQSCGKLSSIVCVLIRYILLRSRTTCLIHSRMRAPAQ